MLRSHRTALFLLLGMACACADDAAGPPVDLSVVGPDAAVDMGRDLAVDLPPPDRGPACADGGADAAPGGVTVSGDVLNFFGKPWRISGAAVSMLEEPCRRTISDAKGHYVFGGLKVGREVTLVLSHKDFPPQQTGTITLSAGGADRFSFQAVNHLTYKALAAIAGIKADRSKSCQIATTVTRIGKSVYDSGAHGEAGATVTISPSLPAAHGPIYFNAQVLPEPTLKATTSDGGVIFVNVPPGQYTITAQKAGVKFRPIKIKCRVGWLANAAPPWGVQAIK